MGEEKEIQDDEFGSMSEQDINYELALPEDLLGISLAEKKELLRYKRSHSELEWENVLVARNDELSKKKDMERLKQLTGAGERKEAPPKKKERKKPAPKKPAKSRARKEKPTAESVSDEEEDNVFSDTDEEASDFEEEDESDDLFDEEELVTISKQTKALNKKTGAKEFRLQGRSGKKRSRLEDFDSSSDEDQLEDEDWGEARTEGDEAVLENARNLRKKKGISKKKLHSRKEGESLAEEEEEEEEDTSEPAELEDIQKIQSRRLLLEQWHSEPFFVDVVRGSYVRYCAGYSKENPTYRMAEVLDVVPMKPYKWPNASHIVAERGLLIAIGSKQLEAKMYKVSNSRITQREFDEFLGVLERSKEESYLPRKKTVEKRRARIREASQHTYTHEEVAEMIKKNAMKAAKHTSNYSHAMEELQKGLKRARAAGDLEALEKVQKEIDKLEREMEVAREQYARRYSANTNINRRNKERNLQMDMKAGVRKREMDMKKSKEEKRTDPFARREARPSILWVTGNQKTSGGDNKEASKPAPQPDVPPPAPTKPTSDEANSEMEVEMDQPASLEELGKRIEKRFGFNPYTASLQNKRAKYLEEVCRDLPDLGTEERNSTRQGISLTQYLQRVSEQIVG